MAAISPTDASPGSRRGNLRRHPAGEQRASNIELFFDLVFVFAVTQLSRRLTDHLTVHGALATALLLAMVWQVWSYTMWVTNWLDPDRLAMRLTLFGLMALSLVMAAGLPEAFASRGAWVGITYAVMQVGRSAVAALGLRDDPLQSNFQRIFVWCLVSGMLAVVGGFVHGDARVVCWVAAVGVDVLGGLLGFPVPGLGRSSTTDWTVEGHHIAERCQAFVLIALGESIVEIGETLADQPGVSHQQVIAFIGAFAGAVALWWIYFDRSAEAATTVVVESDDPGALGRSAYHLIHPVMIAGIIGTAAADELILNDPGRTADAAISWLILGGAALFLAGHAAFKATVWRVMPWTRLVGIAVLALLGVLCGQVSQLTLGFAVGAVLVAVAVTDRVFAPAVGSGPAAAHPSSVQLSDGRGRLDQ